MFYMGLYSSPVKRPGGGTGTDHNQLLPQAAVLDTSPAGIYSGRGFDALVHGIHLKEQQQKPDNLQAAARPLFYYFSVAIRFPRLYQYRSGCHNLLCSYHISAPRFV
jgi:hypothetical protein